MPQCPAGGPSNHRQDTLHFLFPGKSKRQTAELGRDQGNDSPHLLSTYYAPFHMQDLVSPAQQSYKVLGSSPFYR